MIAPVALRFLSDVRLFAPGAERPVEVEVTAAARRRRRARSTSTAPDGWKVAPASQPFRLAAGRRPREAGVHVSRPRPSRPRPPSRPVAHVGDATWNSRRVVIRHEHIPVQLLQPPARLKAVALDLAIKGRRVGYIPGAGDRVAESLEEMGYEVTRLTGADLTPEKLRGLDAVVIGVRAYNVRDDLAAHTAGAVRLRRGRAARSSPSTTGRTGSGRPGSRRTTCGCPTTASPTRTRR